MQRLIAFFLFFIFTSVVMHSQTGICGFDVVTNQLKKDPRYSKRLEASEKMIRQKVALINRQKDLFKNMNVLMGPVFEIPVVVHIIYKSGDAAPGSASNPTNAQVQAAIDVLNQSFAAAPGSLNVGASTPIRFALAKRTPDCNSTSGIIRINGSSVPGYNTYGVSMPGTDAPGANEDTVKSLSNWPSNAYYNIWVVWKINGSATPGMFYTAYTYLPIAEGGEIFRFSDEGTVIMGSHVSSTSSTLTHEMGHAMGLYHTFEGDDGPSAPCPVNNDCTTDGDMVCDTDPVKNLLFSSSCALDTDPNPCNHNLPYNGSQKNLMGYGSCLDRITPGQSTRMMAILDLVRGGLVSSQGSLDPPPVKVKPATQIPPKIQYANNNSFNIGPCNITLGNIQYTSYGFNADGFKYYIDNSCYIGTHLTTAINQTIKVTTETNEQACKAWIDFNNNGIFEEEEQILNSVSDTTLYTHTGTISYAQLKSATTNTLLRLRVMSDWYENDSFGPGDKLLYGQTEDFWVEIEAGLPVAFNSITARLKNEQLFVSWRTASENNNDYFFVQGSFDGENFATLARVSSKANYGNSSENLNYNISIMKSGAVVSLSTFFLFVFLSLFGFKKGKRWLLLFIVTGLVIFIACHKNDYRKSGLIENQIQYLRIAQVDKNGSVKFSNTVRVFAE